MITTEYFKITLIDSSLAILGGSLLIAASSFNYSTLSNLAYSTEALNFGSLARQEWVINKAHYGNSTNFTYRFEDNDGHIQIKTAGNGFSIVQVTPQENRIELNFRTQQTAFNLPYRWTIEPILVPDQP